jgi:glycosyltransferase involved in cell wall biosynthesis
MARYFNLRDTRTSRPRVMQVCHGYGQPFLDVANQYVRLFDHSPYAVTTVYLTGVANAEVASMTGGDEVIFLEYSSRQIRGLKLGAIIWLWYLCRKRGVHFVLAHRYKAIYTASRVPGVFVVGVHHAFGDYRRSARTRFANKRRKDIALLGVSDAVRDDLRASLPALHYSQIATLHNRVDFPAIKQSLLSRKAAREHLGINDETYAFVNVGRLHPDKDQRTLIDAFALVADELPNAHLFIVGEGRLRDDLQGQIDALQLQRRITLMGPIPRVVRLFHAFDSFVLSSDQEPFGMVLLEAMAAGLPVGLTDCGGGPEVTGDTGFLYPRGDRAALAKVLLQLHGLSEEERRDLGCSMEARVEQRFSSDMAEGTFWKFPFVTSQLPNVDKPLTFASSVQLPALEVSSGR